MKKTIIFGIFAALMIFLPLHSVRAAEKIDYSFENSVLLMISNQMRLNGEVESANVGNGHLLSVPIKQLAQQDKNEIDILIELYASQIAGLRRSGNHSPELEDQLINSLEDKVNDLKERAPKLVEVRRSGRRGGLFGGLSRIFKAVGRGTGWLMGRTMEGAGKVVQFGITKVAPKVLEKVLIGGNPLSATLFRTVARDLLIKRVEVAIIREVEKRAERGQVVLDEEEDDGIDYVASLETKSAIEEIEETQAALNENGIDQITVSFTGQMTFQCDQFVGEGGDSQMMGIIPVVVNFDTSAFFGEESYSYVKENGFTTTSTWVYQGTVSQDGVLLGTWSVTSTVENVDVGVIGGKLNPAVGIITEDGSGLYLYTLQDVDTEMLGIFQAERDAIVSALPVFMDPSEYPPTCRQR